MYQLFLFTSQHPQHLDPTSSGSTTTGLGSLIDQIFIGEPAMSPVVVEQKLLSEGIPLGASVSQKSQKQNLVK